MARKFKITIEAEDPEVDDETIEQIKTFWEKEALADGLHNYSIVYKVTSVEEIQPQS